MNTISTRDYIKWVQASLNRIMDADLIVNGSHSQEYTRLVKRFNTEMVNEPLDGRLDQVGRTTQNVLIKRNETNYEYVWWLQTSLNVTGADITVDGIIGPETKIAIKGFQAFHGLTVDGFIGPQTETQLLASLKSIGAPNVEPPGYRTHIPEDESSDTLETQEREIASRLKDMLTRDVPFAVLGAGHEAIGEIECMMRKVVDNAENDVEWNDRIPMMSLLPPWDAVPTLRKELWKRVESPDVKVVQFLNSLRESYFDMFFRMEKEFLFASIDVPSDIMRRSTWCDEVRRFRARVHDVKRVDSCYMVMFETRFEGHCT